jgi:hypothetical protein
VVNALIGSHLFGVKIGLRLFTRNFRKAGIHIAVSDFKWCRTETATDVLKSIPAGINRVQNYQLRVTMPKLKNLFDGSEQLVGIIAYPLFLRQIFLP